MLLCSSSVSLSGPFTVMKIDKNTINYLKIIDLSLKNVNYFSKKMF